MSTIMSKSEYHDKLESLPTMECRSEKRQRQISVDSAIDVALPDDCDADTDSCCEGAEATDSCCEGAEATDSCCEGAEACCQSVDSGMFDFDDLLAVLDATQDDRFIGDIYETLCSTRVSQMTKTYNDIGAVTRLLEEKERDLELAARIGQTLLERNKELSNKNEELEQELTELQEKQSQQKHELVLKEALLQVYVQDYEGDESETSTPGEKAEHTLEALQKKVKNLEENNEQLKLEALQLDNETNNYEEQEQSLVSTCVRQLDELNDRIDLAHEELVAKGDVNLMQQEEISALMGQNINMEGKNKKLVIENAELNQHLAAAQEAQRQLTAELAELDEKYQEVMALLHEAQEEIKALRKKQTRSSVVRPNYGGTFSPFLLPEGSLASELEDSIRKDLNVPTGKDRKSHSKKVMETAKFVRRSAQQNGSQLSDRGSSGDNDSCESIAGSDTRSSLYLSENESQTSDGYGADSDSMYSTQSSTSNLLGRPGIPGSNDLETALRRLSIREANKINERHFEEEHRRRHRNHHMHSDSSTTPTECYTPDSFMSTGSGSNTSDFSRLSGFRFPDKLQIVKPMEGSLTLHRWQRLATPHLGGVLEQRPGVQIKGQDKVDTAEQEEEEIYSLSDYEEDDDYSLHPGKCLELTPSIYTYTNATIMHPNDDYAATTTTQFHNSGKPSVNMEAAANPPSVPQTPTDQGSSGTSTFSMNSSLAASLRERFLNAVPGLAAPARFQSIITDQLSNNGKCPQMETLYTSAATGGATGAFRYPTERAYLNLVGRVKDIGLNNILNIAQQSGLKAVENDPVNIGLNGVMGIRRNRSHRSRVASRGTATAHNVNLPPMASTPKSRHVSPLAQVPSLATIAEHFAAATVPSSGVTVISRPTTLTLTSSTTQSRPLMSVLPGGAVAPPSEHGGGGNRSRSVAGTGAGSIGARLAGLTSTGQRSRSRGALLAKTTRS